MKLYGVYKIEWKEVDHGDLMSSFKEDHIFTDYEAAVKFFYEKSNPLLSPNRSHNIEEIALVKCLITDGLVSVPRVFDGDAGILLCAQPKLNAGLISPYKWGDFIIRPAKHNSWAFRKEWVKGELA